MGAEGAGGAGEGAGAGAAGERWGSEKRRGERDGVDVRGTACWETGDIEEWVGGDEEE